MTSRIGYNIHAQRVPDRNKLLVHLAKVKPAAVLVMDGVQLALDIKAMLPSATVISRIYPDDDIQNKKSPEQWYQERAAQAEGGIFQYTGNEGGFSPKMIDWHIRLMEKCIVGRVPLVIGNMSVGTPGAEDWAAGKHLLEMLDQYRDLFILGLHEYACGVITSGFLGGYPDNAGVAPNSGQKGLNLIPSVNWPSPSEAATMTMFHCGRFKFVVQYCQSVGIKPPRIILTEHGFDDVSDIKEGWSDKLIMTPPYKSIRGWKSVQNQWRAWYGAQGWTPEQAMFEQIVYADRTIYQGSVVEAQLIFCWGHTSDMWDQFDVAEADEFQKLLEGYAAAPPVIIHDPPTNPIYPPLPTANDPRWQKVIAVAQSNVNLRVLPDKAGSIIATIQPGQELSVITAAASGIWTPVKIPDGIDETRGWVSTDVISFKDVSVSTPPKLIEISRETALALAGKSQTAADSAAQFAKDAQALADQVRAIINRP